MMAPTIALDGKERERLVDEFRACLERVNRPPAPADETCEGESPAVDLATLLGEMTVLKNELRLQSRQFKNTLDELRRFGNDLREHGERLQRDLDRAREHAAASRRQTERQFLLALVDLRDRLQHGVDAAQHAPTSFFARLIPGPSRFAASLAEGQRITLQRLDDLLASHSVRPIQVLGEILDPERMRVVGVESAADSASLQEGTVLREVQRGFFHDGELLRVAQVIVSKKVART
jgi:molecular chaperone GrpE